MQGSAKISIAVRRQIQESPESIRALATRYGVNPKTIQKWRQRAGVEDLPKGPRKPVSTVLTQEEEAMIIGVRRVTRLPLDDLLYALRIAVPNLTRSSLHRCLKRHGISRLPMRAGARAKFENPELGYLRMEEGRIHTPEGTLHVFSVIDEVSRILLVQSLDAGTGREAAAFLKEVIRALPYQIKAVFSDDWKAIGPEGAWTSSRSRAQLQLFNVVCNEHGIAHLRGKLENVWDASNLPRINRTLAQSDTTEFQFSSKVQLREHQAAFAQDFNFKRKLKALHGLTPHEFLCQAWARHPERFLRPPHHESLRLNITGDGAQSRYDGGDKGSKGAAGRHVAQRPTR